MTAERDRLADTSADWKLWGPYLSERAWGTVREDYSATGEAWEYFPHDHARSRAYRWNEDGLGGISDREQHLCFALALWNGQDPILKERMFGLTGGQGNHGEDVKEVYYYLDSTPTHSFMRMLYKYPQAAFPYADLVAENEQRGLDALEYELWDTGVFDEDRYFDVVIDYAKAGPQDILIRITAHNRGPDEAPLRLLPTLWFRNTWGWGYPPDADPAPHGLIDTRKPTMQAAGDRTIRTVHGTHGTYYLAAEDPDRLLFTDNETNAARLFGLETENPYVKDAFHRFVIEGDEAAVNPARTGTKAAADYALSVPAGEAVTIRLRLSRAEHADPFADFDAIAAQRATEADAFYATVHPDRLMDDEQRVQRQAFAGMMWTKQLYYYDVQQWMDGDPGTPPPESRKHGRNRDWRHLNNFEVISMPDKWEYPWYATWDLAFHMLPIVLIDPDFAKRQLLLFTREWYMHPNGQLPAYEWAFSDVNPPVHAWAAWRVYKIDAKRRRAIDLPPDRQFLEEVFHKLLLNFTWWVNRKDADGNNIFQGGFLGLDNISVLDRSALHIEGIHIDQSDGTAWMGFFSAMMIKMALELARDNPAYQAMATKFFEHYLRIAHALNDRAGTGISLWDDEDGFYYDHLHYHSEGRAEAIRVRSLVGLMPLIAVETLPAHIEEDYPEFDERMHWFLRHRPEIAGEMADPDALGEDGRRLLSFVRRDQLERVLRYMLDETEFLSPHGIRSVSKAHEREPYSVELAGTEYTVAYWPAESKSGLFGGNSNWRGPVWFPINFLLIEALQRYHHYYGDELTVECPVGSGQQMTLWEVATELSQRLIRLFLRDSEGRRPIYGGMQRFQTDPHWCDHLLFHEYFHGDIGAGLGASHQTGWTGLVAKLIQQSGGDLNH
ncbi:MAG: glucosidase [Chloroflexi bacterium]|nr:glucosidase [Chloroflexota bacterium]